MSNSHSIDFSALSKQIEGEFFTDNTMRSLYATDASVYRELPIAVAYPKVESDLKILLQFATENQISLIPRTAGTSLAGQCVGKGIVLDFSKYWNKIIALHKEESSVIVQPGVVRDELNQYLKPHGLFFGPNTSTANRAMIGGMIGNNSCGSYSIVYGSTREHVLALKGYLSNGEKVEFTNLNTAQFEEKCKLPNLEGQLYCQVRNWLQNEAWIKLIQEKFPHPDVTRRNTGYALDALIAMQPFNNNNTPFNFSKLICGSEGTLMLISEIKLKCVPIPPQNPVLLCAHFSSINESMKAAVIAMQHQPRAVELMDHIILECTAEHPLYKNYRFFVEGNPQAILAIEFAENTLEAAIAKAESVIEDLKKNQLGYAYPQVKGSDIKNVWDLRAAGLGLLSNVKGSRKPVAVIEDTAVAIQQLPSYIEEFSSMMSRFQQTPVYYAHAGAGELHLRPLLDLKNSSDRKQFRQIATESAALVKKYNGSISGEHGDGRLRAEFIPYMVGHEVYDYFCQLKNTWDAHQILNPGKITQAPPMDTSLRYEENANLPQINTILNFNEGEGILSAAEKCNGSGDCRKSALSGGTMCPSYMATKNEKDTTRARANLLREFLTHSKKANRFDSDELYQIMSLCLSCKGCKSECPSNVDMAAMKAEFLYQYHQSHSLPLSDFLIAHINTINKWAAFFPTLSNKILRNTNSAKLIKKILHIHPKRNLPLIEQPNLRAWYLKNKKYFSKKNTQPKEIILFADEFTLYQDTKIGVKAIQLLHHLGYNVLLPQHQESGRAFISKGMLLEARQLAEYNVEMLHAQVSENSPLIGIEPSAILSFVDEYPNLVRAPWKHKAQKVAQHTFTLESFLYHEWKQGHITPQQFTHEKMDILLHTHCHQKALQPINELLQILSLPQNYSVIHIPSGCCGMAGGFGYDKKNYDLSMQIGELILFPAIRKANENTIIAASGTSCRHQIFDGTQKNALHPIEILWGAVIKNSNNMF